MGPDSAKISKKLSNQPFFEEEKSLDMGRDFRPRAAHAHPRQKIIRVPPPFPGRRGRLIKFVDQQIIKYEDIT